LYLPHDHNIRSPWDTNATMFLSLRQPPRTPWTSIASTAGSTVRNNIDFTWAQPEKHNYTETWLDAVRGNPDSAVVVHKLPAELLQAIFKFSLSRRYITEFAGQDPLPWEFPFAGHIQAMLTSVCKRWRAVALNTPVLWTDISPGWMDRRDVFERAVLMFLERVRYLPVNLVVDNRAKAGGLDSFLRRMGPQLTSRLRSIYCRPLCDPVHATFDFPAPVLESLSLQEERALRKIETPLFQGHAPRLQYLSLTGMVWVPKNQLPSLTHLHLRVCGFLMDHESDFVVFLQSAPALTDLVLSVMTFVGPIADVPYVNLHKLRRLTFDTTLVRNDIRTFMASVSLAEGTSVRFQRCELLEDELTTCPGLQTYVAGRAWTRMSIKFDPTESFCSVIAADASGGLSGDFAVAIEHRDYHRYNERERRWVLPPILPFPGVRECWIMEDYDPDAMCTFSAAGLRDTLEVLSELEALVVCAWNCAIVLDALSFPVPHDADTGVDLVCPRLSTLTILARNTRDLDQAIGRHVLGEPVLERRHFERVVVGYLPGFHGSHVRHSPLDEFFNSAVEYAELTEYPAMELPEVCTTEAHTFWPKWRPHTDGLGRMVRIRSLGKRILYL